MSEREPKKRLSLRLIVGAVALVLVFVFIVENTRQTKMRFLIPQVTAPLWTALFVAALLGAVVGVLLARHSAGKRPD